MSKEAIKILNKLSNTLKDSDGEVSWSCSIDFYYRVKDAIKEIQNREISNCDSCVFCKKVFSYTYPLCNFNENEPFQIHNSNKLKCNDHKFKKS
jgi:hypothetical protein